MLGYNLIVLLMIGLLLCFGCGGPVDQGIQSRELSDENFIDKTPYYKMKVGFRVGLNPKDPDAILNDLDTYASEFLACLYGNPESGFYWMPVVLDGEETLSPPLWHLRVLIALNEFECASSPTGVCAGLYTRGHENNYDIDTMVVSMPEFERTFKHELNHRQGGAHGENKECIKEEGA